MQQYFVRSTRDVPARFEQIVIPLSDGTRLTARLWLPETRDRKPVPVVLESIPYRQSDGTAIGDSMVHGYFAENGIAGCRLDLRGSGNSEGTLGDEYLRQEQDDVLEVIAWLARQEWCTGNVGMIGISWGGFAALQLAARRPPALKAIITACSTDDRYSDDVHFMGGALLNDGIQWGHGLFSQLGRPPDPAHAGDGWRALWQERLEALGPPLARWLRHMERDAFWQHGSVCEDYAAIDCAVWAVGGWVDGYSDAILRLMQHLDVPRKALIGPWTHMYPTWGQPGPRIGFLQECVRWWRHWLMGEETGIMDEPRLRLWLGRDPKPDASDPVIAGGWIGLDAWPPEAAGTTLHAGGRSLTPARPEAAGVVRLASPPGVGAAAGEWCPLDSGGSGPEFALDARTDDALSLCFDTPPLAEPLHLVGTPVLSLKLTCATQRALLAVRLNEVAPGGTSARVTFGLCRLRRPASAGPNDPFEVSIPLKAVAHAFGTGRSLRLALSTSYWPMAWPEAEATDLGIEMSSLRLSLPGLPADVHTELPDFGPAIHACPIPATVKTQRDVARRQCWDLGTGEVVMEVDNGASTTEIDGLRFGLDATETYAVGGRPGGAARADLRTVQTYARAGWNVRLESSTGLAWKDGALRLEARYEADEGERQVFARSWQESFEY